MLEPAKLRFDDDYGCFRDPENRDDFPGDIKLIPLDQDEQVFLRVRFESHEARPRRRTRSMTEAA